MTNNEFSDQFDTLLNSYNIQAGFGEGSNKQGGITLNEYEKSVLLTQAQDEIVKSYFDRTLNHQGQGFDGSSRRQVDFSSLIKVCTYKRDNTNKVLIHDDDKCYDDRGLLLKLDKKILFMLNERLIITNGIDKKSYTVVPINYREYDREMSKSYGQPLKNQAWRLFSNASTGYDIYSEIIPIYGSNYNVANYLIYDEPATTHYAVGGWGHTGEVPDYHNGTNKYKYTIKGDVLESQVKTSDDIDKLFPNSQYGDAYRVLKENENIKYIIRYVERPTPIVLVDLPNGLSIDGETQYKECNLNPILHDDILNKAFELAITTRGGGTAQRQQDNNNQRQ